MTNCPNCGAPLTGHKCRYCGAVIFDFAAIEIGKPTWINFKLGERWVLAHVLPESASMRAEPMELARIELDFIEIPTDKGYGHIVSERGAVSSTDLEGCL